MDRLDGYMGKVLFVDLTNRTHELFPWTDKDRKRTLGGKVMAADILLHHIHPGMQAFDEDNWLVVTTGPLTGCGPISWSTSVENTTPPREFPSFGSRLLKSRIASKRKARASDSFIDTLASRTSSTLKRFAVPVGSASPGTAGASAPAAGWISSVSARNSIRNTVSFLCLMSPPPFRNNSIVPWFFSLCKSSTG